MNIQMKGSEPLISIIIPVYNAGNHFEKCLHSLKQQKLSEGDFEIIIIDDGSTDNSMDLASQHLHDKQNITFYSQLNRGVSIARNKGIELARGKYLIFLDADDALAVNVLHDVATLLASDTRIDVIIYKSDVGSDIAGPSLYEYNYPPNYSGKSFSGIELSSSGYMPGSLWGVVFNKRTISENEVQFPEGVINGEDSIFVALVYLHAKKILHIDKVLYMQYPRKGSASQSWNKSRIIHLEQNIKYLSDLVVKNPNYSSAQLAIIQEKFVGVISMMLYQIINNSLYSSYGELRHVVRKSHLFPISFNEKMHSRFKAFIMSISLDVFFGAMILYYTIRSSFVRTFSFGKK